MVRPAVVVMGVSGSGKSTIGRALAAALHLPFLEGDTLHSPASVDKMSAGIALTDADRESWLQAIGDRLRAAGEGGLVVSCSALKRSYRDRLRAARPGLRFVFLHGARELLADRMGSREGHCMPPSMLESQLRTLEPPGDDEMPIRADIAQAPQAIVDEVRHALERG
jgi:carbohydrate kinase (thermoresistant glucokinase family)